MTVPLFPSKLRIPSPPSSYLPRPRIDRVWSESATNRVLTAFAGAGFGKTSFLAANAARPGRRCFWYSLDESDIEAASFFAHVGEAARHPRCTAAPGVPAPEKLLSRIVRDVSADTSGCVFVFDDVQIVAGAPEVLTFLGRLARFLPDRCTLVLSSREPVAVPEAKFAALGRSSAITASDLRFTEEEIGALFAKRFPGRSLERSLVRRIAGATEGWAAGIEILFQAAGAPTRWAIERALEHLGSAGLGWFGYFAEEVVSRLDEGVQDFLLRSSVLPRLDAALCDRALGIAHSAEVLDELNRRNLFTFCEPDSRPASYRYHHLFREFLRDRLARRAGPAEVRALRLRAAGLLVSAGAWTDAAALYAEAGDHGATLAVIEEHGEQLLESGHYRTLRLALESVPSSELERHAAALIVLGRLQEIRGEWDEAKETHRKAYRAAASPKVRAESLAWLGLVEYRRGAYAASDVLCRRALAAAGTREPVLRAAIHVQLALSAAEQGRLATAEMHFTRARALSARAGDAAGEGRALLLAAVNVHYFRGDLGKAKDGAREALVVFQKRKDLRRVCHTMGVLGFLSMTEGDAREGRDLTEAALRIAESLEYRMIEGYCHLTLGRCALLARDAALAREHLERSRRVGEELREPALRTLPRLALAELALAEGNAHAARGAALDALEKARERRDIFQSAQCRIVLGAAEAHLGSGRAGAAFRSAEKALRSMGAALELHRLLLIRLDRAAARGEPPARALAELVRGAARRGHAFLFLVLEPERSARVLARALAAGIEPDWVSTLLVRLGARAVPHVSPLVVAGPERIRARAVEILAQLGGDEARSALVRAADAATRSGRAAMAAAREMEPAAGPPLRIEALGPMRVSCGELELTLSRWRSKRAARLFQLLLVHRFRWVPKDAIIEALWPEIDPAKGENSLRQTVHLLRRELEPGCRESRAPRLIRFRNDAYRLDPGDGHTYDVELFEAAIDEGLRLADSGRPAGAERLCEAVGLYRGGFFEESPYEEFAVAERERLRDRFLRALDRLVRAAASSGRWDECAVLARRGIADDPYSEDLHWHLVNAYLRLGSRHEALAAYHRYERTVLAELEAAPSLRMKALAEEAAAIANVTPA